MLLCTPGSAVVGKETGLWWLQRLWTPLGASTMAAGARQGIPALVFCRFASFGIILFSSLTGFEGISSLKGPALTAPLQLFH